MAAPSVPAEIFRPEYVRFLLNPSTPLDFHVNVGEPNSEELERIGAVRWMLIARSQVLRVMLLQTQMEKPNKEFDIPDLEPETFKNLLTFIYGHNNTGSLPFEDSIKLLTAAEKYDVEDLKKDLTTAITPRVTVDNVLTVLQHGPVCDTSPDLWDKATEIIQSHTDIVFGQEKFLTLHSAAVVHIIQQDILSVKEVDVWRAALKWARYQLYSGSGEPTPAGLRRTMVPLMRHTRLCTLTHAELCETVVPTQILTPQETGLVFEIMKSLKESNSGSEEAATMPGLLSGLDEVCTETRNRLLSSCNPIETLRYKGGSSLGKERISQYYIFVKKFDTELVSVVFGANEIPSNWSMVPSGLTYQCQAWIRFARVTNYEDNSSSEPPTEIVFNEQIPYGKNVEIPLNVILERNTKYSMHVQIRPDHWVKDYNTLSKSASSNLDNVLVLPVASHNGTLKIHWKAWRFRVST